MNAVDKLKALGDPRLLRAFAMYTAEVDRIGAAILIAGSHSNTMVASHLRWVIDQMLRALLPADEYTDLVTTISLAYPWDTGTPPLTWTPS